VAAAEAPAAGRFTRSAAASTQRRGKLRLALMLAPITLWLLAFQVVPLLLILVASFASRGRYGGIVYKFGVHNYVRFLDPLYLDILVDSVGVAALTTAICLLIGYPFAYFLAQQPLSRRHVLLLLVVIPFWTNLLTRTYAWMIILRGNGLLNTWLMGLGIISEPIEILYTMGASVLGLVYVLLPFMVLPLYASIEKFDHRMLRAAYDLGATPWQAFRKVMLPLTMPGVIAGSIFVFIPSLALFFIIDLLGGARTILIGNLIHRQFTQARDWPFGAAASVILTVMSLVLIFLYVRFFNHETERVDA